MSVELTQPVAGLDRGATYSGDLEKWLVANGYAKQAGRKKDVVMDLGAEHDPTLASNREAPGEPISIDAAPAEEAVEKQPEPATRKDAAEQEKPKAEEPAA